MGNIIAISEPNYFNNSQLGRVLFYRFDCNSWYLHDSVLGRRYPIDVDINGEVILLEATNIFNKFRLKTTSGSDSISVLNLTINNSEIIELNDYSCNEYIWFGQIYNSSGHYEYIDSNCINHSLNLIISYPSSDTNVINITAIDNYIIQGQSFTENGTYFLTLLDHFGCDSIVQLNLIIENSYLNNPENMNLTIYPNPSLDGKFFIKTNTQFELTNLIDFSGREVNYIFQDKILDLNNLSRGVYFAVGKIDDELIQFKLVHSD